MIDVSFLLLIFFLVATSLQIREKDVPMTVAGRPLESERVAKIEPIKLSLRDDGTILVGSVEEGLLIEGGGDVSALDSLQHYLTSFAMNPGLIEEPAILLKVEDKVKHQRFTEVMSCLNYLQLDQVAVLD